LHRYKQGRRPICVPASAISFAQPAFGYGQAWSWGSSRVVGAVASVGRLLSSQSRNVRLSSSAHSIKLAGVREMQVTVLAGRGGNGGLPAARQVSRAVGAARGILRRAGEVTLVDADDPGDPMSAISTAIRRLVGGEDDAPGPVQAIWNGVVIASSDRTVVVEGNQYFPPGDVDRAYLEPSDKQSVCPWKGRASYYDIVVAGDRNRAAAWYYQDPSRVAENITGHVAFWHGVKVRRAPQP